MQKDFKTLVIGLGEIGYHNSEYMTQKGLTVDGYDINKNAIKRALKANIIQKEAPNFKDYDCYMICVSTHNPKNHEMPSLNSLFEVTKKISNEASQGSIITIESTITKGISNKINKILKHKLHVAHAPHRFYAEEKNTHGINQTRVLGGCYSCCLKNALHFYERILEIPMHIVENIEIAELTKIIENTYRMIQIAFAEELKIYCNNEKIDFQQLRAAINSKWNINILEARSGINGHCLPKDSQMYIDLLENIVPFNLAYTAKIVDKTYKKYINDTPKNPQLICPKITIKS
jgi:UDP-N-acetyl-D-mannosaminuronic acid dehydrogenase